MASYGGGGRSEFERAIESFESAKQAFAETGYVASIPLLDQKIELSRKMMAGK